MEPYLAQITMFAGNFAPRNWALCQGQILPINQNQSLYSLLGTTYGGDGRTTFALPDLRGVAPIHKSNNHPLGQRSGSETNTLNANNLPSHTHTARGQIKAKNGAGDESNPGLGYPGTASTDLYANASNTNMAANVTIGNAGSSSPINNMQPYLSVNYIICISGLFPSRN